MAAVTSTQVQIFSGGCGGAFRLGYDVNCLLKKKDLSSHERAAILTARFAETIAKVAGNSGQHENPETLERKKRLGEAKMKALIRKEELEKEADLKRKRSEEREVARKKLEMVEKTADVEDNFQVMRELEELIGGGGSAWADLEVRLVEEEEEDDGGSEEGKPRKINWYEEDGDSGEGNPRMGIGEKFSDCVRQRLLFLLSWTMLS